MNDRSLFDAAAEAALAARRGAHVELGARSLAPAGDSWWPRFNRLECIGLCTVLAFVALVLTAINMFGGFAVTRRMLAMFRK